jgi:hypothetical protein
MKAGGLKGVKKMLRTLAEVVRRLYRLQRPGSLAAGVDGLFTSADRYGCDGFHYLQHMVSHVGRCPVRHAGADGLDHFGKAQATPVTISKAMGVRNVTPGAAGSRQPDIS